MKITRVDVFGYDLHYVHGSYAMSGGRVVTALPSTVVRLTTDTGLDGWGEVCPLGPAYLPAFAEGARAALRELGVDCHVLAGRHVREEGDLPSYVHRVRLDSSGLWWRLRRRLDSTQERPLSGYEYLHLGRSRVARRSARVLDRLPHRWARLDDPPAC